jgi:hypothetical protein
MESKKDHHLLIKCVTEVWMRLKRHVDRNHAFFCALCVCVRKKVNDMKRFHNNSMRDLRMGKQKHTWWLIEFHTGAVMC